MKTKVIILLCIAIFSKLNAQKENTAITTCQQAIEKVAIGEGIHFLEAQQIFEKAITLFQKELKGNSSLSYCQCQYEWGKILIKTGYGTEALAPMEQAYEQLSLLSDLPPQFEQKMRLDLARLNYQLQNYVSAKNLARTYLNQSRTNYSGDHPSQYEALNIAAQAYLFMDYPETAFKYAQKGVDIADNEGGGSRWKISFYEAMIDAYWQQGKQSKALTLLKETWLPLIQRIHGSSSEELAHAYHLWACYELNYDRSKNAQTALKKSLAIYRSIKVNKGEKLSDLHDSWFYTHLKKAAFDEAWPHLDAQFEALCLSCKEGEIPRSIEELKIFVEQHHFSDQRAIISLLHEYQLLYLLEHERQPAVDLLTKAIGFGEVALDLGTTLWMEEAAIKKDVYHFLEQSYHWQIINYQELEKMAPSSSNLNAILHLIWKKKMMQLQFFLRQGNYARTSEKLLKKERDLSLQLKIAQKALNKAYLNNYTGEVKIEKKNCQRIRKEMQSFHKSLVDENKWLSIIYRLPEFDLSLKEFQKKISSKCAYLEYVAFDEQLYLLVIEEDKAAFYELNLGANDLNNWVQRFERMLYAPTLIKRNPHYLWQHYTTLAQEGYNLFLAQALKNIDPVIEELNIAADGPIRHIHFDVFLTKSDSVEVGAYHKLAYLMKDYSLAYQYAFFPAQQTRRTKPKKSLQLLHVGQKPQEELSTIFGKKKTKLGQVLGDRTNWKKYGIISLDVQSIWMGKHYGVKTEKDSLDLMNWDVEALDALQLLCLFNIRANQNQLHSGLADFQASYQLLKNEQMLASLWPSNDTITDWLRTHFFKKARLLEVLPIAWQTTQLEYLRTVKGTKAHPYYWAMCKFWGEHSALKISKNKPLWQQPKAKIGIQLLVIILIIFIVLAFFQFKYRG